MSDKLDLQDSEITVQSLYDTLIVQESIIITLDEDDVSSLKRALKGLKGKTNMKLKQEGLAIDTSKIEFNTLPIEDSTPVGMSRIQISLVKKKAYKFKSITTPSEF